MTSAAKFFADIISSLPKGIGGAPAEPEKHNLYWGLHTLAKQMDEIQRDQQQALQALQQIAARLR